MSEKKTDPKNLTEAIEILENACQRKVHDFKDIFEKEYLEIRKALDELKPHLKTLKKKIDDEATNTKTQVEDKIKDKPWLALGAVGLIAFFLGWLFGNHKKD
jgi:ElaB/YqjD/DUF883 family membrane-anchored ribosome-binding protein